MTLLTPDDPRKIADLRRMKAMATGLLVLAAAVYVVAVRARAAGGPAWVGYVVAAAEAGMVGGLADWFAVTALFRRPLGLPIPHTAIIPNRKDALGQGLGDFVGTHFLAEEVVRERLRGVDLAGRVGRWLADPERARRVTAEAAALLRGALQVLRDDDVRAVLEQTLLPRLRAAPIGPPLGRLLDQVVKDGAHTGLVDLVVDNTYAWLSANKDMVIGVVASQAPAWSPRFVDERIAERVYLEVLRVAGEVQRDPLHPLRDALDRFLLEFAEDLREDEATQQRAERLKEQLLDHPRVRSAAGDLWVTVRTVLVDAVEDEQGELRVRATLGLSAFGDRLVADAELRAKVNGWAENVAAHVVTNYRDELTRTITDTVDRWDGEETARRIELQVGRDLQFIRVNGTVVGALAGLAIYGVSQLLT